MAGSRVSGVSSQRPESGTFFESPQPQSSSFLDPWSQGRFFLSASVLGQEEPLFWFTWARPRVSETTGFWYVFIKPNVQMLTDTWELSTGDALVHCTLAPFWTVGRPNCLMAPAAGSWDTLAQGNALFPLHSSAFHLSYGKGMTVKAWPRITILRASGSFRDLRGTAGRPCCHKIRVLIAKACVWRGNGSSTEPILGRLVQRACYSPDSSPSWLLTSGALTLSF